MDPADARTWIQSADQFTDTYIGTRTSTLGIDEHVGIPDQHRLLHTLTVGPTGAGKSQVMVHAALQDAEKDHGLALIVPKGALIDEVLAKLPEERLDDVIYINPNKRRVPAVNVLDPYISTAMSDAEGDRQQNIIVDDLTAIFRRLSQDWGERWGRNLRTLLHAHIHLNAQHDAGMTLMDVFQCITDDEAFTDLLDRIHQPMLYEELTEIQQLSDREMEPLQRRFRDFLESRTVRRVITQTENTVNFRQLLTDGKILLVDVQKGELGPTAATLIGGIIITRIWSAAQSRITIPEAERTPFHLYVDELHSFTGEGSNFQTMLSEAREYRLSAWCATQYLRQLPTDMRSALLNNCRTKIFFDPSSSEDLGQIARLLNGISKQELTTLGNYRAALQTPSIGQNDQAVVCDTYPPWKTDMEQAQGRKQAILEQYDVLDDRTSAVTGQKGHSAAAGKEHHAELLAAAHSHFTEQGWTVNILYQDGETKPDGHLMQDDELQHLEAECETLSKPVKVLRNVERAVDQDRSVVFVVPQGKAPKLANILSDPVNRRGDDHEDDAGTFSYYTDEDTEFTNLDSVQAAQYRVFEQVNEETLQEYTLDGEPTTECPELDAPGADRESLQDFCLYRTEDGHCDELGLPCPLVDP